MSGRSQKMRPRGTKNYDPYNYENNNCENEKNENEDSGEKSPQLEQRKKDSKEIEQGNNLPCTNNITSRHRITVPDLERLWLDQIKRVYPEYPCPTWTRKEFGQVKHFLCSFQKEHPDKDISELFSFVIQNWNRIDGKYFRYLKNVSYPQYPCVHFFMGFKRQFLMYFGDTKFSEWKPSVTEKERVIKKLRRMGYTEEQALEVYKDQQEKSSAVIKHAQEAEQATRSARAALREKEKAEREVQRMRVERDREREQSEKLNRGSLRTRTRPKAKPKYDKDGFSIFEN